MTWNPQQFGRIERTAWADETSSKIHQKLVDLRWLLRDLDKILKPLESRYEKLKNYRTRLLRSIASAENEMAQRGADNGI